MSDDKIESCPKPNSPVYFGKHQPRDDNCKEKAELRRGLSQLAHELEPEINELNDSLHSIPCPLNYIFYFESKGIAFGDVIGEGTYGKVWKAIIKLKVFKGFIDYKLACKRITITPYALGSNQLKDRVKALDDAKELLMNEQNMLDLEHENLITKFWVNRFYSEKTQFSKPIYFLSFMELCGGNLLNLLEKLVNFNDDQTKMITIQISKGLHYLHDNKIAHLNLKLENVLYQIKSSETTISYLFKLSDFGLVQIFKDFKQPIADQSKIINKLFQAPEFVDVKKRILFHYKKHGTKSNNNNNDNRKSNEDASKLLEPDDDNQTTDHIVYDAFKADIYSFGVLIHLIKKVKYDLPIETKSMTKWIKKFENPRKQLVISMTKLNPNERPSIADVMSSKWLASIGFPIYNNKQFASGYYEFSKIIYY